MFKKIDDLFINMENPFANDILKREPFADALTNLIETTSQPMVLSINGPWGAGKTKFLEMWQAKLKNDRFPCVFFNAWENDFSKEPFISFILEIEEAISELNLDGIEKTKTNKVIKGLKEEGAKILKHSLPLAVRIASQGLININAETDSAIDQTLANAAEDSLKQYSETKQTITSFREKLAELSDQFKKKSESKPIIIFIDELDRCRPSYAIKLLENIKHLFATEGFVFVLGIDREQLGYTVQSIYGQGMNADAYLKRFIDIEFPLPAPETEDYISFLLTKFNLWEDIFKERIHPHDFAEMKITFVELSRIFNLDLRTQNQCMTQLNIISRIMPQNNYFHPHLITYLILLKNINTEAYDSARLEGSYESLISLVESNPRAGEFLGTNQWFSLKACLLYSQYYDETDWEDTEIIKQIGSFNTIHKSESSTEKEKKEARRISDLLNHHKNNYNYSMGGYLTGYIDMAKLNY